MQTQEKQWVRWTRREDVGIMEAGKCEGHGGERAGRRFYCLGGCCDTGEGSSAGKHDTMT